MSAPLSHTVNVRTLPRKGRDESLVPDEEARGRIAAALDLVALERAEFEAHVAPWRSGGVEVEGRVRAELVQSCVVSNEPVPATIDEPFTTILVPEGSPLAQPDWAAGGEMVLTDESDDPPETFSGDAIDLGAIWFEYLSLAIDPFPRAPDAELPPQAGEKEPSPFAALAGLKLDDPANDR